MKSFPCSLILCAIVLSGCASPEFRPQTKWRAKDLIGEKIKLDDPFEIIDLRFLKGGMVTATYGTKEVIMCPVDRWRIQQGRLQIVEYSEGTLLYEYELLSWQGDRIRARESRGKEVVFIVENWRHTAKPSYREVTDTWRKTHDAINQLDQAKASVRDWRRAAEEYETIRTDRELRQVVAGLLMSKTERASLPGKMKESTFVEHYSFGENLHALVFFSGNKAVKVIKW